MYSNNPSLFLPLTWLYWTGSVKWLNQCLDRSTEAFIQHESPAAALLQPLFENSSQFSGKAKKTVQNLPCKHREPPQRAEISSDRKWRVTRAKKPWGVYWNPAFRRVSLWLERDRVSNRTVGMFFTWSELSDLLSQLLLSLAIKLADNHGTGQGDEFDLKV